MSAQPPYRTCAFMLLAYVTNSLKRLLGIFYVLYVFSVNRLFHFWFLVSAILSFQFTLVIFKYRSSSLSSSSPLSPAASSTSSVPVSTSSSSNAPAPSNLNAAVGSYKLNALSYGVAAFGAVFGAAVVAF